MQIAGRESQMGLHETYESAPENEPFLITGSSDTLEISLKSGNANTGLQTEPGQIVTIL